jgi:hypothetical protein
MTITVVILKPSGGVSLCRHLPNKAQTDPHSSGIVASLPASHSCHADSGDSSSADSGSRPAGRKNPADATTNAANCARVTVSTP